MRKAIEDSNTIAGYFDTSSSDEIGRLYIQNQIEKKKLFSFLYQSYAVPFTPKISLGTKCLRSQCNNSIRPMAFKL